MLCLHFTLRFFWDRLKGFWPWDSLARSRSLSSCPLVSPGAAACNALSFSQPCLEGSLMRWVVLLVCTKVGEPEATSRSALFAMRPLRVEERGALWDGLLSEAISRPSSARGWPPLLCVLPLLRQCCVGTELVDWMLQQTPCVHSRIQAVGMWQVLVEDGVLNHGKMSHGPWKTLKKC